MIGIKGRKLLNFMKTVIKSLVFFFDGLIIINNVLCAGVVELADARDSKSRYYWQRRVLYIVYRKLKKIRAICYNINN